MLVFRPSGRRGLDRYTRWRRRRPGNWARSSTCGTPARPWLPADLHGRPVVLVGVCWTGVPGEEGRCWPRCVRCGRWPTRLARCRTPRCSGSSTPRCRTACIISGGPTTSPASAARSQRSHRALLVSTQPPVLHDHLPPRRRAGRFRRRCGRVQRAAPRLRGQRQRGLAAAGPATSAGSPASGSASTGRRSACTSTSSTTSRASGSWRPTGGGLCPAAGGQAALRPGQRVPLQPQPRPGAQPGSGPS